MERPPLYLKLWIWMLLQASYKDHGDLRRGQFFATLNGMREAMAYKIGYRVEKPSKKEIRGAMKVLSKVRMMGTMKVTHGLLITILNYDLYQSPENYEGHDEGTHSGHTEGTIPTRRDKERRTNIPFPRIIDHLNEQTGKRFRHTTKITRSLIQARWNEGNRADDFFRVIDIKSAQWRNTPHDKYLRPETLFGPKFESYVNEKHIPEKQQSSTPEWF